MPAATTHTLGAISLPRGMVWVDELNWSTAERASERTLTGALIIDAATRIAGRPITLEGEESAGWISRATLIALHTLAKTPLGVHTLALADGRAFEVMFAPDGEPIEAKPIARPELPANTHPYVATLRLITAP